MLLTFFSLLGSRKEYEDTRKMKRVSFKSVKASMTGKKKETAAKEEQEYHVAFEREKACALQLERSTAELNQASMLVGFSIHISIVRSPDQAKALSMHLPYLQRDRTQVSKDEIERLRDSLDQLYEDVMFMFHHHLHFIKANINTFKVF